MSGGGDVAEVSTKKRWPEDASVDSARSTAIGEGASGIVGSPVTAFSGKSINPLDSAASTPSSEVADAAHPMAIDLPPVATSSDEPVSAAQITTDFSTDAAIELIGIALSSEITEASDRIGADFSDTDVLK
jgi:hypothetical protein